MEDAHTHLLSLPDDPKCAFFAVYDGHGGPKVSQYAGINLHKLILQQNEYRKYFFFFLKTLIDFC